MSSTAGDDNHETVVLVHGLYMRAYAMWPLKYRLSDCGFQCRAFSYPSFWATVAENTTALSRFLDRLDAPIVHYVCHSLGGIVVRNLFHRYPRQRPGRVLALGTPHEGSYVARSVRGVHALKWLLGKSVEHGLDGDLPWWPEDREIGTIAGDLPIGAGRLVPGLPTPNDGAVAVAETRVPDESPHVVLSVTHSGMLLSRRVAECACHYLKTGRFPDS